MVRQLRRIARNVLFFIAVILIFFEEWLFQWLKKFGAYLGHFVPVARFEAWVVTFNPFWTTVVLAVPWFAFLPLKFLDAWLFLNGHWIMALGVLAFAKVAGVTVLARLFTIGKPKLLSIRWFAWAYAHWTHWSEWAHRKVRESGAWQRLQEIKAAVREWKARQKSGAWGRWFQRQKETIRRKWRSV